MEKKYFVALPKDVVDELGLTDENQVLGSLNGDRLTLSRQMDMRDHFIPSWILFLATAIASLIFVSILMFQKMNHILLTGNHSIMSFIIPIGTVIGTIFFTATLILNRDIFIGNIKGRVFWRMLPVIVISFGIILVLILLGFSWLLGQLFGNISFDVITSTILFGIMCGIIALLYSQLAHSIRIYWLTSLFSIIITSGVCIAMATNSNRQWWQFNLSFLGTQEALNSWQFNLTLILSAVIIVALVDYLFVAITQRFGNSWKLTTLRVLLTLLGIDLGAVGYFPNDAQSHLIHTDVAGYLVYLVIILIITARWLLPNVTKDFLMISYTIGGLLIFLEFLFQGIHYLSLTAYEMAAFLLAFTWLVLLLNKLEALIGIEKKVLYLDLVEQ